jgi:hypothetical protein
MEDNNWGTGIRVQGEPDPHTDASIVKVSSEYFDSVGTHLVMGRGIGQKDIPGAPAVAVVNREFAKKLFNGRNPIGRSFGTSDTSSGDYQIVGVVEDTTYTNVRWKNHRMYFLSILQRPASATGPIEHDESLFAGALVLATDRPVDQMAAITQRTLAGINPNLTLMKFQTFDEQIAGQFTEGRMIYISAATHRMKPLGARFYRYDVFCFTSRHVPQQWREHFTRRAGEAAGLAADSGSARDGR